MAGQQSDLSSRNMATPREDEASSHSGDVATSTERGQVLAHDLLNVRSPVSVLEGNSSITVDKDRGDYVSTPALEEADEILQNTGRVILCGPPGCGKTTLAYALSRRSRKQGFTVYTLERIDLWRSRVGERERSIVLLDGNFGKIFLDAQQHGCWSMILDTILEQIRRGMCRLVITLYPHVLRELQQLENKWKSPLLDDNAIVQLTDTLPEHTKESLLNFHLNQLHLGTDRQTHVVQKILQIDASGPVFPWCCDYMVSHWSSVDDPTAIFSVPAEAHAQLLKEMVLDKTHGHIFVAVLALSMNGVFHFLHNLSEAEPHLQTLGIPKIYDDTLARYADILQGSVLMEGGFSSRALYEAAGLALGRFFRLPTLLRVCDVPFLIQYVHTSAENQGVSGDLPIKLCVTVGSVPSCSADPKCCGNDLQALLERIFTEIIQGNLQYICQHPCLQCPEFLQELDKYCSKDSKRFKQLLNAVDVVHQQPLVYWSAFLPSHNLTHWCLSKIQKHKRLSAQVLVACSLLDYVMQDSGYRLQASLHNGLSQKDYEHPNEVMDFPLPGKDHCLTKVMQKQIELITGTEFTQRRLLYLRDLSLFITPDIVMLQMTPDKLQLQVRDRRYWYLVFRLLTDRGLSETDRDGNSLLHVAVNCGALTAVKLSLKAGAGITQQNRQGVTPYQLAHKTRSLAPKIRLAIDPLFRCILQLDQIELQLLLLQELSVNHKNRQGWTGLLVACHEGREDVATLYIKLGADVNAATANPYTDKFGTNVDWNGESTPLHHACRKGMGHTADLLIQHRADVAATTKDRNTALHFACQCPSHTASAYIARLLVRAGADVNARNNGGNTPLQYCGMYGHSGTAEVLICHGADVNTQNKDSDTPLLLAAYNGHSDTAEVLMHHGADVNARDKGGYTPLLRAAKNGRSVTTEVLVHHGADVNTQNEWGGTPLMFSAKNCHASTAEVLLCHGADVNTHDEDGDTPLVYSAMTRRFDTAEVLIQHGADVNKQNENGNTPLLKVSLKGLPGAAEMLIRLGADINTQNEKGKTPLRCSAMNGHTDTAELLIHYGADVNTADEDGNTPLLLAAYNGHSDTVEMLIRNGADVNTKDKWGKAPLQWAVKNSRYVTAEVLVHHGADVNTQNERGSTPLMHSVKNPATSELLLYHGADVNAQDKDGDTPLLLAVKDGSSETIEMLIRHGADVNTQNKDGDTPLLLARLFRHSDIVKLLERHGARMLSHN